MDARFSAGKFKGRWYSDVACQETSFCAWSKKQKTPPGYLRPFIAFLKGGSRRGQSSIDTFVQRTPGQEASRLASPATATDVGRGAAAEEAVGQEGATTSGGSKRMDFTLSMEIVSPTLFDVTASNPDEEVPHSIQEALTRHPDSRPAGNLTRWRFAAEAYPKVLRWLQFNQSFRCRIEEIPQWVLLRVLSFAVVSASVQAADTLKLSAATKRILAELGPVRQGPSVASPSASVMRTEVCRPGVPPKTMQLDTLIGTLMPFQVQAVEFCLEHGGRALLGDEMGLGKTVTALAVALQYKAEWPMLIVAPAPLCSVWQSHAVQWLATELSEDEICVVRSAKQQVPANIKMQIVSYNLISEEKFQRTPRGQLFEVIIVDECHQLRGATTKRSKATVPLARVARRSLLLSGTPLVSRAEDAFPILDAILPDGALPAHSVFAARYRDAQQRDKAGELRHARTSCVKTVRERLVTSCRLPELHTLLQQVMLRRTKKDVLQQLPAKRRQRIVLDLPKVQGSVLSSSNQPSELERAFDVVASSKISAVADYVQCLLQGSVKFLLFAHHLRVLNHLEEKLQGNTNYIRIDGGTPMSERMQAVKEFQEDEEVLVALLSITACSQGLTLHAASVVVFAELYWVPGVLLQAEDRAHRLGQVHSVDVHYLVAPGSVDDRMYEAACRRASDAAAAVEDNANSVLGKRTREELSAPIITADEGIRELHSEQQKKAKIGVMGNGCGESSLTPDSCREEDDGDLQLVSSSHGSSTSKPFSWARSAKP